MKTIKKRFLVMSFQYAVNVIGLPLYIDFFERTEKYLVNQNRSGNNMQSVKYIK